MAEEPNESPLASVSFQPTLEDHIAVAILQMPGMVQQSLRLLFSSLILILVTGYFAYVWYRRGYTEPAVVVSLFAALFVVQIIVNLLRRKQRIGQTLLKFYEENKNIELMVPTMVQLNTDYLKDDSVLSASYASWAVVEAVKHQEGYLLFKIGGRAMFVPDRAFGTLAEAQAFRDTAVRLYEASRSHDLNLREPPPWHHD